ncbi:lyase containing HEAT-repeat [unidentified eubacterium SCB49]|nr:lyase containing HEAT-repeat [unidentified eubacterium SCB49]
MNKLIFILTLLLFISCNEKREGYKVNDKTKTIVGSEKNALEDVSKDEENIVPKVKSKSNSDYLQQAELFAKSVLKENFRTHKIDITAQIKPTHTEIFQNVGLIKINAYSNQNYPEKVEPNRYEHFILFVATYDSEINALKNFALIKMASEKEPAEYLLSNKKFTKKVEALKIGTKPGGMIIQKDKQIFSLVETCRRVPIHGIWNDYENKLISHLADENGEEFQILNSNCGDNFYRIETRKAIKQQGI